MMKRILLSLVVITLSLGADEIQRIESIVEDITHLRTQYETCQEQLRTKAFEQNPLVCEQEEDKINSLSRILKDEKQKNNLLLSEVQKCNDAQTFNGELELQILELDNANKKKEKLLKSKDLHIANIEEQYQELFEKQESIISSLKNQINKSKKTTVVKKKENTFPKLVMRDTQSTPAQEKTPIKTKAYTYRLKVQSDIYGGIDGEVIDSWEAKTSFTSDMHYENWIKITGYFVDQQWGKAKEDLWVLQENVHKRD